MAMSNPRLPGPCIVCHSSMGSCGLNLVMHKTGLAPTPCNILDFTGRGQRWQSSSFIGDSGAHHLTVVKISDNKRLISGQCEGNSSLIGKAECHHHVINVMIQFKSIGTLGIDRALPRRDFTINPRNVPIYCVPTRALTMKPGLCIGITHEYCRWACRSIEDKSRANG